MPTTIRVPAPVFTDTIDGIVPASGGGTSNFLRADGTWQLAGGGREILSANRDYYVNDTTGLDSNTGLSSGTAFKTIQKAITVATSEIDINFKSVFIRVADGTYTGPITLGPGINGYANLVGNNSNPLACIIQGTDTVFKITGDGVYFEGFNLKATAGGSFCCSIEGKNIFNGNLAFTSAGTGCYALTVQAGGSLFSYFTPVSFYGANWASLFYVTGGSNLQLLAGYTVNSTPAMATASLQVEGGSTAGVSAFSGTATGKTYTVTGNSSAGGTVPPGNIAGTVSSYSVFNSVVSADVSTLLNLIGSTHGMVLYRGVSAWEALAPGTPGNFLKTSGPASSPSWDAAPGATGGEANTGVNVGTAGVGVFKQKSGVSLEFKKINSTSAAITLTDDTVNSEIDITLNTFTTVAPGGVPLSGGGTTNFLRADGAWAAPISGGGGTWGSITGTLSAQLDLQAALDTKAGLSHSHVATEITTGTLAAARLPAFTGDVTSAVGTAANVLADNVVTNVKAADMATARIKGRTTAGTGDPEDLTGTQATALLDVVTTTAKGLVPIAPGGTTSFLNGNGAWSIPGSGGVVIPVVSNRTLIAAESGTIFTNEGAPGLINFTLPAAAAGLRFHIMMMSSVGGIRITPAAGDQITSVAYGTTAASGYIEATPANASAVKGNDIELLAVNATDWMLLNNNGGGWPKGP